jgi:hypothetical protein
MGMHVGSGTGATRVKPERPCTVHRRTVAFAPRRRPDTIQHDTTVLYAEARGSACWPFP